MVSEQRRKQALQPQPSLGVPVRSAEHRHDRRSGGEREREIRGGNRGEGEEARCSRAIMPVPGLAAPSLADARPHRHRAHRSKQRGRPPSILGRMMRTYILLTTKQNTHTRTHTRTHTHTIATINLHPTSSAHCKGLRVRGSHGLAAELLPRNGKQYGVAESVPPPPRPTADYFGHTCTHLGDRSKMRSAASACSGRAARADVFAPPADCAEDPLPPPPPQPPGPGRNDPPRKSPSYPGA